MVQGESSGSEFQTANETLTTAIEIFASGGSPIIELQESINSFLGAASDLSRLAYNSSVFSETDRAAVLPVLKAFWKHENTVTARVRVVFDQFHGEILELITIATEHPRWETVGQCRAGILRGVAVICNPWLQTRFCEKDPEVAVDRFIAICESHRSKSASIGTADFDTEQHVQVSVDRLKAKWSQSHRDLWHELKIAKDKASQRFPDRLEEIDTVFAVADALRGLLIQLENIAFQDGTFNDFSIQQIDELHTAIWNNRAFFDSLSDHNRGLFTWREVPAKWRQHEASNVVELIRDVSLTYSWILHDCSLRNTLAPSRHLREVHPEPWFDVACVTEAVRRIKDRFLPESDEKNATIQAVATETFISLCTEIICRLEEPAVDDWADRWWDDIEALTTRLFEAQLKLDIGCPVSDVHKPALLISTITKKKGVHSKYHTYFRPITSNAFNTAVMMRYRDPETRCCGDAVLYTDCRKYTPPFPTLESQLSNKKQALKTVRQWLRTAQRSLVKFEGYSPTGFVAHSFGGVQVVAKEPLSADVPTNDVSSEAAQAQLRKIIVPTNEDVARVCNLVAKGIPVQTAAKEVAKNSAHSAASLRAMYYKYLKQLKDQST